jgi:Zn-dependent M28 family amino/carboxypeptidase
MLRRAFIAALAVAAGFQVAAAETASAANLSAMVRVLASDEFQGRAPGTAGEAKTVAWLIERCKALGLEPGGENGGWTQSVPLVRTQVAPAPRLVIEGAGAALVMHQGEEAQVSTLHPVDKVAIESAPLVFVGYGVSAPERGWDDFKGADLAGKVPVFLVNDPDFEAEPGEPVYGKFGGKAMTYYGRWTYKFEEAARRGAVAALIVHETAGAGYGWTTVTAPQGEAYDMARGPDDARPIMLQGWIHHDAAIDLFKRAGLDFENLKKRARSPDFRPLPIGAAALSAELAVSHEVVESRNVLARIAGAKRPDETIFYGAHWDAYGVGAGGAIRPGANDDALGVAGVLEIARLFAKGKRPRRSVVFALWTAEERGLLGSESYAAHPLYPLDRTVANFTIDIMQTAGLARDVMLVGAGQDSLERDLAAAAKKQGRGVTPDTHPEKGLFYRADHFSFAKRGVPTLLMMAMGGGADLVKGGRDAGNRWVEDYTANCYHKACDAWSPDWDLRGAAQDVTLLYQLGRGLAFSKEWPSWNDASEFKSLRPRYGNHN